MLAFFLNSGNKNFYIPCGLLKNFPGFFSAQNSGEKFFHPRKIGGNRVLGGKKLFFCEYLASPLKGREPVLPTGKRGAKQIIKKVLYNPRRSVFWGTYIKTRGTIMAAR